MNAFKIERSTILSCCNEMCRQEQHKDFVLARTSPFSSKREMGIITVQNNTLPNNGSFNPSPHNYILDLTELKAFADEKLNDAKIMIFVFDVGKQIVGKGQKKCW